MPNASLPEIQRTSLLSAVLYLKSLDLDLRLLEYDFVDPPEHEAVEDAVKQLYLLGALNDHGRLTQVGEEMALLPVDPSLARSIICAIERDCLSEVVKIAAVLSVDKIFTDNVDRSRRQRNEDDKNGQDWMKERKKKLAPYLTQKCGDHIMLLRIFEDWRNERNRQEFCKEVGLDWRGMKFADNIVEQLFDSCRNLERKISDGRTHKRQRRTQRIVSDQMEAVRHCLSVGFANRVAKRAQGHNGYWPVSCGGSGLVQLHPLSVLTLQEDEGLLPEWVVYSEYQGTTRPCIRFISPVKYDWIERTLIKLKNLDMNKLLGGMNKQCTDSQNVSQLDETKQTKAVQSQYGCTKHSQNSLEDARSRYLKRKKKTQ
eukprot:TRINITY_DN50692_c0_g1_i1.p1 TRINITY_DN50692_c0_g1~~TRINITY_DN50692_c0_g1_i1.p1  ORF type:complete len:394 (+),score=32.14 TRINITY_DN50692_c0_g1_i1:71-1183(+)